MTISLLGVLLLSVTLMLCVMGLISGQFDDNLLHCVGLAALLLWSLSELRLVLLTNSVSGRELWLYAGIACFGSGTALRTYLYHRKERCMA